MKRPVVVLAVVLALVTPGTQAVLAGPQQPDGAAPTAPGRRTVVGTVRLLAADSVEHAPADDHRLRGRSTDHYRLVLLTDTESFFLKGRKARPNTRVRVSGVVSGRDLQADDVDELAAAPAGVPPRGSTRVLVLLAHWNAPDSVTPATAHAQMFTDSSGYFQDASYRQLGQTGDVTPWLRIAGPAGGRCFADMTNVMTQARNAATGLGYDPASYGNVILYFPNNSWQTGSDCNDKAGWAYVGASGAWLNGYLDRRVTVHEQGHNYGLLHSHSHLCSNGMTGACQWSDYGDDFDAMGSAGFVGHFSASQKHLLGWLTGRTVNLTAGGGATLAPYAADALATTTARIDVSANRSYWLEYRQARDFDANLPPWATDGVLVHVQDVAVSNDHASNLIDARPADGASTTTATIRAGSSWRSPEGFEFRVGTVTATGATVSVAVGARPVCPDAALEPDAVETAPTVAVPTTQRRAFCAPADQDWVRFAALAGRSYRLETLNLAAGVPIDTVLNLYAPDGTTLVASNDDTVGLASRLDFTPTTSGTYFLRATEYHGYAAENFTYDLALSTAADATAPVVTARAPGVGATNASRAANLSATFSEAVAGVGAGTFTLRNAATGAAVTGAVTRNGSTNQWLLNPGSDLVADTRYTVTLTGGAAAIRDLAGNPLATTTWSFTAGPAPVVTARVPGVGATNVSRTANLSVTFSEAVAGVGGGTFTLKNAATGAAVTGAVTRNGSTNQWILNPGGTLAASTRYTGTLTGGATAIRDAAGNPLTSTSWSFTTGG